MDERDSIKALIDQAKNTRYLVYQVAAAYVGTTPDKVKITVEEKEQAQN